MDNDSLTDIKKEISHSNFSQAFELLSTEVRSKEELLSKEVDDLKKEMQEMNKKIDVIQRQNKILIKEKNIEMVKQYSARLVCLIDNEDLNEFKKIIEEHEYPIDEFITRDFPDVCHMNFLHYSIDYTKDEFVYYLIKKGANVNVPDLQDKWTPIMYALQKQNIPVARALLKKGANLDVKDVDGFTPLSIAVDSNNKELIQLVLKFKPQIDKPKDIVSLAKQYERKEIVDLLTDYFGFRMILYDDEQKNSIIPKM